jgi:methylmalonyl-CoA mutase
VPVIGITGTGGAGKSSVTDELLNRFLASFPEMRIAVISVDPTRAAPAARCSATASA